jgi:hypothetical protein
VIGLLRRPKRRGAGGDERCKACVHGNSVVGWQGGAAKTHAPAAGGVPAGRLPGNDRPRKVFVARPEFSPAMPCLAPPFGGCLAEREAR